MDFYDGKHWDDVIGSVTMSEWNPAYGYYYSWNEDFNRRTYNISRNIVDKLVDWMCQEEWKTKIPPDLTGDDPSAEADTDSSGDQNTYTQQKGGQNGNQSSGSQSNVPNRSSNPGSGGPSPSQGGRSTQNPTNGGPSGPNNQSQTSQLPAQNKLNQANNPSGSNKVNAQEVLDNVWMANNRHEWTYNLIYTMSITGDAFVKFAYDPNFYADDMGEIVMTVLDSRTVIPYWDGHNKTKMVACKIQYPTKEVQQDGSVKTVMYQEVHTESTIYELQDGQIINSYVNPMGEIMIVHFPNERLPYRKYGRSDLENLLLPNKEYNEKASDFSEILAYHASPVTVIKGARVQQLERGARKIWGGIPKDGDVFNLELQSDLSSTQDYLNELKKHLHECGNVPEEALGAIQEVSNTSAAALHIQYQPLIEKTKKKQLVVARGLRKLNEFILRFYQMAEVWEAPEGIAPARMYRTEIEFGDALPRDRSLDLADIASEIGLGIESKKGALIRLGVEDPDAKLAEIEEELKHDAELQFQTAGMFGDMGQNGTAPGAEDGPQNDVSGAVNAAKTNSTTNGSNVATQAVKQAAQGNGNN